MPSNETLATAEKDNRDGLKYQQRADVSFDTVRSWHRWYKWNEDTELAYK